jgi:hypothetical protein
MTTVVLIGFFLMLFAPCVFAIFGGREKKGKAIVASYEDRAVNRTPDAVDDELDLPVRIRKDSDAEYMVQTAPPVRANPQAQTATMEMTISAPPPASRRDPLIRSEEPIAHRTASSRGRSVDLKSVVEQAENEALVAHAMAAQANAAAMAATARAAQARAQAAAEHAVAANKAAANHAAAVREAQRYAAASAAALGDQPTWPELSVAVAADEASRRAA